MKLQFDPSQAYQIDAIHAIADLFEGQPLAKGDFELQIQQPEGQLQFEGELLIGNNLMLDESGITQNLHIVQERNGIDRSEITPEGLHFSLEMETGTGKTYVYLRTIHELHKRYGFKKFIIVVPSIAIKEGVLKNLQITKEHFDTLYEKPEMDFRIYDPKKRGQIKHFATTNTLQVLVINIDSFAISEEKKEGRIIYQNSDWGIPIRYLQATRPIVIVDEPQNMETDIRKKAIANLNPLCTLRYSATHKNPYNLVYRLDPVQAYDLGLVKRIEVDSVLDEGGINNAYVKLIGVSSAKNSISIKLEIDMNTPDGIKRKAVIIRKSPKGMTESDLYKISNQREVYRDGYSIASVDVKAQTVTFSNGNTLIAGQTQGGNREAVMRLQIQKTIETHFAKEQCLRDKGIKVLSLFFVDRVANYRTYQEGTVAKGKFALWFEEIFREVASRPQFRGLMPFAPDDVHNGYFSQDRKGTLKDTNGTTKDDDDTYALIMKEKEKLLSSDVPLRFIFSHSALREGWDNPNVFQICTLNETRSDLKKRQEIGRGLRLPVNQDGQRVYDRDINVLTVTANESYEDFAKTLQTEIEQECGVKFTGRIKNAKERTFVTLKGNYKLDENFRALWERIKHKTRYQVTYDTDTLIKEAAKAIAAKECTAPKIRYLKGAITITAKGIGTEFRDVDEQSVELTIAGIPDVLSFVQDKTRLTKDTICRILLASGKAADILKNPQQFMDTAVQEINRILRSMMVDGIKYEKIAGDYWNMERFENAELKGYLDDMVKVQTQDKTLYDFVKVDSDVETQFAKDLEGRTDVKFYVKLPRWFTIETPIGNYNPDWAIVFEKDERIYFVAETKSSLDADDLRKQETMKMQCGERHFEKLDDVYFQKVTHVSELLPYSMYSI